MASIVLYEFGGMIPRAGEEYLPAGAASEAANCNLLSGEIRPLHTPDLLFDFLKPVQHSDEVSQQ